MNKRLLECIDENIETISSLQKFNSIIEKCIKLMTKNMRKGGKIMLCGNGGSAADAQHLAAEFLIRLNPKKKRPPLPAIALSTDTSTITACGNDYNFDKIFERTFEALFKKNDILIAISTSGNSKNIINVLKFAKKKKILSIGFLGKNGGKAKFFCDLKIIVDSLNTARIQESHIFLGHYIFSEIENRLFK
jgi:D-sedoheptulose 7-phosphate isomerase